MKIWLDDIRTPPDDSWHWSKTAEDAIGRLADGSVTEISLDHDLGESELTGYSVACYIERAVSDGEITVPVWHVHSANPVGACRIKAAMRSAGIRSLGR